MHLLDHSIFPILGKYLKLHEAELYNKLATVIEVHANDYKYEDTDQLIFLHEMHRDAYEPELMSSNAFFFSLDLNLIKNPVSKSFCYNTYMFMFIPNALPDPGSIKTTYKFACASRNFNDYRPNKIYNYIKLKEKPYFNEILYTKFQLSHPFDIRPYVSDAEMYEYAKVIEREYYTWPMASEKDRTNLAVSMTTIDLPVYQDSLFQITAESVTQVAFLSEKTFKVFAAGQIPIMCGPQNSMQLLKDLGFDIFDDIVDHAYYDSEPDWKLRITKMHQVLDHVATLNHEQIKFDTYKRRLYNQQRLKSVELQKMVFGPIITTLKQHLSGD